jgi:hypothetical protein
MEKNKVFKKIELEYCEIIHSLLQKVIDSYGPNPVPCGLINAFINALIKNIVLQIRVSQRMKILESDLDTTIDGVTKQIRNGGNKNV